MKGRSIQRRGSYLYTAAYRKLVFWAELIYIALGLGLAILAWEIFDSLLAGAILFAVVLAFVSVMWLLYLGILWFFKRESTQSVEITDEGIMEKRAGREHSFIPWTGVLEIELNATVLAGGSLRVKGTFSTISISNVDLAITGAMRVREMPAAVAQTRPMRELLSELVDRAPSARLRMNRLARRRMKESSGIGNREQVTGNRE
jgi:hypothetical protein